MTLKEMKTKVLSLIEEIDTSEQSLTSDIDIEAKMPHVINQVQFELSRIKKIPSYVELTVSKDDLIDFSDIKTASNYDVYQLDIVRGIEYEYKAQSTIIKCLENGTLEIEYFRYPTRVLETSNDDTFKFDLSDDVLEIMPYGIAGDLLRGDVSTQYGSVYTQRYEQLKQQLDIRYNTGSIEFVGGLNG